MAAVWRPPGFREGEQHDAAWPQLAAHPAQFPFRIGVMLEGAHGNDHIKSTCHRVRNAVAELNRVIAAMLSRQIASVCNAVVAGIQSKDLGRAALPAHGDGLPAISAAMVQHPPPLNQFVEIGEYLPGEIQTVLKGVVSR